MINKQLQQEVIDGDLEVLNTPITNLGNVKRIDGRLDLDGNRTLKSLGILEYVGNNIWLRHTNIEELGNLKQCKKLLLSRNTKIPPEQYEKFNYKFVE